MGPGRSLVGKVSGHPGRLRGCPVWRKACVAVLLVLGSRQAAAGPALSVSPGSLEFGEQVVNTASASQTVTVTNTGDAPLTLSSFFTLGGNMGDFSGGGSCGLYPLAPSESCTVGVRFLPLGPGFRSTTLFITSNAPGSPHTVSLSGTGIAAAGPAIGVQPASLAFGDQPAGTPSAPQTVTITNTGAAPLVVHGITVSSGEFTHTGSPGEVPPGGSRTVEVVFAPTMSGERSAALSISHNAAGSPHTVALSGRGTAPPPAPAGPKLSLSATTLSFGSVNIGESAERSVTVSNTGSVALTILSMTLGGSDASRFAVVSGGGGGVLLPGTAQTLTVRFSPGGSGSHSAQLAIESDAAGSPNTVRLTGTGRQPPAPPRGTPRLVVTPTRLQFTSQVVGTTSEPQSVRLSNTGTAPLVFQSLTIAGAQRGDFTITAGGGGGTLPEGASRTISVAFTPTGTGTRIARLAISDNATGSPSEVPLEGTGRPAPAAGDWPVSRGGPRQLGLADGALDPRELTRWSLPLGGRPAGAPVVRGGSVYVGTDAGTVLAIDTQRRTQRWQRVLPAPVRAALAVTSETVLVSAGGLYGLSVADGAIRWQRPDIIPGPDAAPMLIGEVVYIGTRATGAGGRATVHALSAATGADLWPAPVLLPEGLELRTTPAAYPEIGLLFLGLGPPGEDARPSTVPGAVIALRLADGGSAWAAPAMLPGGAPPVGLSVGWVAFTALLPVPQPAVYAVAGSRVVAFSAATGAAFWTRNLPETVLFGPPTLSTAAPQTSTLYVGSGSGRVYALSSTTGANVTGGFPGAGSALTGPLTLAADLLFLPTVDGLAAAEVKTGEVVWSHPGAPTTGAVIAAGSLYAATSDGRLIGFSP